MKDVGVHCVEWMSNSAYNDHHNRWCVLVAPTTDQPSWVCNKPYCPIWRAFYFGV